LRAGETLQDGICEKKVRGRYSRDPRRKGIRKKNKPSFKPRYYSLSKKDLRDILKEYTVGEEMRVKKKNRCMKSYLRSSRVPERGRLRRERREEAEWSRVKWVTLIGN